MKKSLVVIFASSFLVLTHPVLAASVSTGRSYVCHFGKYGEVKIDTRDPGASIIIGGVRYPAVNGSYFYQTVDGKVAVAFNPDMTAWTLMTDGENRSGITDSHCKVVANEK
ncbi:hypothetical protein LMG29660_02188 [Burkholderia puraquae]|uniref:C-type lysozyme inhibitor domain-containing protein n=2 Tax=Burkholderia puraquae TaxID=1904757 RepID=A0A6J5DJS7_9BURK|nr:hypothetical protein LMG29660_02188 [Burkholderia puraquae]